MTKPFAITGEPSWLTKNAGKMPWLLKEHQIVSLV